MERQDINEKYKWDYTILFKTEKDIEQAKAQVKDMIDKLSQKEGLLNNPKEILNFLKEKEVLDKLITKLDLYSFLKFSACTADPVAIKLTGEVESLTTYYSVKLAFVSPELALNSDELLDKMLLMPEFEDYTRIIEGIKRDKPHTISADKEKLLAEVDEFTDYVGLFNTLTDAELNFDPIITNTGEKLPLTQATYGVYSKHKDRDIRMQASNNLLKGYKKINLTLCHNYIGFLKNANFKAKTYNFNSSLDKVLFYDEVEKSVYESVLKSVRKNTNKFHRYLALKSKLTGIKDFCSYDINAPIGNGEKYAVSYDTAVNLVKASVKCLGEEYSMIVDRMFSERWVDVFPTTAKMAGAYSTSDNSGNPFMMLNYEPIYRNISTISHELGHSVHSYLSEKYQPYFKAEYTIFVAEIVSILNEILLAKYLINNETDSNAIKFIADGLLFEFNNNVFYAGMEAELEEFCHLSINKGESITYDDINQKYEDLMKEYYGEKVKITEYNKYGWARHCQFYNSFYLFKYSFGFLVASNIYKNIEKGGKDYIENHYLKFLKAGCSQDPVSLLKLAKVDITSEQTYLDAFKFYDELLNILEK